MVRVEQSGALWRIVLDRPEKANALTGAMLRDIAAGVRAAHGKAQALIVTGAGPVFSAGADLDEVAHGLATDPAWEAASRAIADLPCLTIAALNGALAGGAFGIALACDIRLAVPDARFFYPVMARGLLPQPSDPGRMRALIGQARTAMILSAGARVQSPEALAWGLIDRIAAPEALLAEAEALCQAALGAAPDHVAAITEMVRG